MEEDLPAEFAKSMLRQRRRWWLVLLLAIAPLAYGTAYVGLSEPRWVSGIDSDNNKRSRSRIYPTENRALPFVPAAWVESQITGKPVRLKYKVPPNNFLLEAWEAYPLFPRP